MFTRFISAIVLTLFTATSAFAACALCMPPSPNSGAYSIDVQNGVTVMRGNIPSIRNPNNALIAERNAAEKRANDAQTRAAIAQRDADNARAQLAARPVIQINSRRNDRRSQQRFSSGNFGFGASISEPRFRAKGRGARGGQGISRPVFSRGIRS